MECNVRRFANVTIGYYWFMAGPQQLYEGGRELYRPPHQINQRGLPTTTGPLHTTTGLLATSTGPEVQQYWPTTQ